MTQYQDKVEIAAARIKAEEWAKGVKSMHAHDLTTMWYTDRDDGQVLDIIFNSGRIERTIIDTEEKIVLAEGIKGQELISQFMREVR